MAPKLASSDGVIAVNQYPNDDYDRWVAVGLSRMLWFFAGILLGGAAGYVFARGW